RRDRAQPALYPGGQVLLHPFGMDTAAPAASPLILGDAAPDARAAHRIASAGWLQCLQHRCSWTLKSPRNRDANRAAAGAVGTAAPASGGAPAMRGFRQVARIGAGLARMQRVAVLDAGPA